MIAPSQSSNAGTLGESCSDMSALTSVFKALSPEHSQTLIGQTSKAKFSVGESINQRCDLMLAEQLTHLQDLQLALEDSLDQLEGTQLEPDKVISRTKLLFEKAQHGSVLVSCIGKMQTELLHSRQDLQNMMASSDREALTRVQERVRWLETRIEQVLHLHRQSVLEGKRAKMAGSLSPSSTTTKISSGKGGGSVAEIRNTVNLGPLPFPDDLMLEYPSTTTKSVKSGKSQKSKAGSTVTRFTVPSTSKSEDLAGESSLWNTTSITTGTASTTGAKRLAPHQPLWHTLPLVPRNPIEISMEPFNREVPWLDRRGSSYDLLREEFNELMDKVGKVYAHILTIVDSSHETDVNIISPTNVSSRMSRMAGDGKSDYDCYGLEPPLPLKWSRLSRSESNIYPRPTKSWHNGTYLAPVRRIANQSQSQHAALSRQHSTITRSNSEKIRVLSRSKLARAKTKVKLSVMASVSLQRFSKLMLSASSDFDSGLAAAQKDRLSHLINENLKSEIAKVRKEAARDLGLLYKSRPTYEVVNALKETVYTDNNIFVLIESSRSLISIGIWDTAALEVVLQAIKYGSQDLRCSLLESLRKSSNPHHLNKQSVQFRVLHGLLLNLIRRGSHVPREEVKKERFVLGSDTPSLPAPSTPTSTSSLQTANSDTLASRAALVCAYFYISDSEVRDCLQHFLRQGSEDLQSWSLVALTTNLGHHSPDVIRSCLNQMKSAVKWENRASATKLIVKFKTTIEDYGLSQLVFEDLEYMLYDDCSREVRKTVSHVITSIGIYPKMLQVVIRKLDDVNEDVRAQGVMSLSILGIKGKSLLNQLLDILELDSSIFVRIQVMRAVKELNIVDRRVIRLLRERARGSGPMCKEAQVALYALTGDLE